MNAPVFATLGCRLNAYESEAMKGLAAAAGLEDAVVVNTCAVTGEAVRQARQQIRRLRRQHPQARIVVTGCAAQTEPATFGAMPEVDAVLGNGEKLQADAWARLAAGGERVVVGDIMAERRPAAPMIDGLGTRARAYVQVQTGCDHRCTFCIIPYGRGNSRSVPAATVVEQVAHPDLKAAIAHCESVGDYISREILEDILESEEEHIDWLETQLDLVKQIGLQNYLQSQMS